MGIQNYFIRKKIKKQQTSIGKADLVKIKRIAIVVDESSSFNDRQFKNLQKLMGLDDTHFQILTIKHKKSNYNEFKGVVLLTNEINWKGEFKTTEIQQFLTPNYDLLIDFIPNNSAIKHLIVSEVKSILKVGYHGNPPELYNITLQVDETKPDVFIAEMVKYLRILNVV